MLLDRLMPAGDPVSPTDAAAELNLRDRAREDRPAVALNMVATADGHAGIDGKSAPLSSQADRAMFHALRAEADAVLAGTTTLAEEGYRRLIRDPDTRAAREARGLPGDPVAIVLSRSGELPSPADAPLLDDPDQPVVSLTGDDAAFEPALRALRTEHDIRALLCEGGPLLAGALVRAGLVDDVLLTLAPLLVAGADRLPVLGGDAAGEPVALDLVRVLAADGALFLRYRVAG